MQPKPFFRNFHSLSSGTFEIFDLQKVDCWKKAKKIETAFLRLRLLNFAIAIVLRSFDQMEIADHSCLVCRTINAFNSNVVFVSANNFSLQFLEIMFFFWKCALYVQHTNSKSTMPCKKVYRLYRIARPASSKIRIRLTRLWTEL